MELPELVCSLFTQEYSTTKSWLVLWLTNSSLFTPHPNSPGGILSYNPLLCIPLIQFEIPPYFVFSMEPQVYSILTSVLHCKHIVQISPSSTESSITILLYNNICTETIYLSDICVNHFWINRNDPFFWHRIYSDSYFHLL